MMVFLFITGLFNRNIADDESTLAVAFLELEGFGNCVERLEGEREVGVAEVAQIAFCGFCGSHLRIYVCVGSDAVG